MNRFASEHPSIEKIDLLKYQLKADDAIIFIRQLNFLKTFKFRVDWTDCTARDRLRNQLDNEWQYKESDPYGRRITLTRANPAISCGSAH